MNNEGILDEQKFPYENMTLEERNYYINILKSCKDICDSINKVDNQSKCEIVSLNFKKEGNVINANGFLTIGSENRCIDANIYISKKNIIVDMQITRLLSNGTNEVYTVLDEFTVQNDKLKRFSQYNVDMKSLYDEIENKEMKGRLK